MRRIIEPAVCDFLVHSSQNLFNASQSGDPELAEAVLVNLRSVIDSYIQALADSRYYGTN